MTSSPGQTAPVAGLDAKKAALEILITFAVGAVVWLAARGLRLPPGPGPLSVVAAVLTIWLLLRRRGSGCRELGLGRPRHWGITVGLGFATWFGAALTAGLIVLFAVRCLGVRPPDLSAVDPIRGNLAMLLYLLIPIAWGTAAFGEEIVFRGFLLNRLGELLGRSRAAWGLAVLLQAAIFGLCHAYQGKIGVVQTGIVGLIYAGVYLATRRNLWVLIIAHATTDTYSLLAIFFSLDKILGAKP